MWSSVGLRDADQLDDLVAETGRAHVEQQVVAAYTPGLGTTGDDLVGRAEPGLRLRRAGLSTALQPFEFAASEDPATRLGAGRLLVSSRSTGQIGGVRARARLGAMDVPGAAFELDDPTAPARRGQSVHEVTIVGDHHECCVGAGQALFEPLDRFEVEVVRGFVEQDHVELAHQRTRQRHPLGLPARQLIGGA